jgi:hypothetical protein
MAILESAVRSPQPLGLPLGLVELTRGLTRFHPPAYAAAPARAPSLAVD